MPLDDADKKFIGDLIRESLKPETIGAAVKSHLDGLKLDEVVASKVKDATKDLQAPKRDEGDTPKGGKAKDDDGGAAAQRLAQIEKALADERKAREEAEQGRKRDQLHSAARDALIKAGVPAERVRHAMATLKEDGVLDLAADGTPGWKGKDRYGVASVLSVEEGAAAWVKTDDGKAFLPPTNLGGTGEGAGKRVAPVTAEGKIDLNTLGGKVAAAIASLPEA